MCLQKFKNLTTQFILDPREKEHHAIFIKLQHFSDGQSCLAYHWNKNSKTAKTKSSRKNAITRFHLDNRQKTKTIAEPPKAQHQHTQRVLFDQHTSLILSIDNRSTSSHRLASCTIRPLEQSNITPLYFISGQSCIWWENEMSTITQNKAYQNVINNIVWAG